MKKHWLIMFTALALMAGRALALPPADEVVKRATSELQELIRQNHVQYKSDLPGFYKVVDEVVVPHFDLPFIARSVLARNWKTASEDQRARFQSAFKNMLIRSYANALLEYHDSVKSEWKPLRMAEGAEDVQVNASLLRGQGKAPVAISFSMHVAGGEWRVYDISVENISLVTNFRGQLNAEVKKASLEDVILRMENGGFAGGHRGSTTASADTHSAQTTASP